MDPEFQRQLETLDEIRQIRASYLSQGGTDHALLHQLHTLEAETRIAMTKSKFNLKNNSPSTLVPQYSQLPQYSFVQPQFFDPSLRFQEENSFQGGFPNQNSFISPGLHPGLPNQAMMYAATGPANPQGANVNLNTDHIQALSQLKFQTEQLKLQTELEQLQQNLAKQRNIGNNAKSSQNGASQDSREDRKMKTRTPISQASDVIYLFEYNPSNGFIVYFDFILSLPSNFHSCSIIYGLFELSKPKSKPTTLRAQAIRSQDGDDSTGDVSNTCSFPVKSQFHVQDCPANPQLYLMLEVQDSSHPQVVSYGWTKLFLFDKRKQLCSGRWRLNLKSMPARLTASSLAMQSFPNMANSEICLRLVDARQKSVHDAITPQCSRYDYLRNGKRDFRL